jgi:hypothetical protein
MAMEWTWFCPPGVVADPDGLLEPDELLELDDPQPARNTTMMARKVMDERM